MQGPVIAVSEVAVDFVRQIYTAQSNNIQFNSSLNFGFYSHALVKFIQHHHTTTTNLLSSYKTCRVWFTLLECLYSCIIPLAYWIRNHYSTLNKTLPSHKYIYMAMASNYKGCINHYNWFQQCSKINTTPCFSKNHVLLLNSSN